VCGADGVPVETFGRAADQRLAGQSADLRARPYCPQPVGRKLIPKSGGGTRPQGIPNIRDRVVRSSLVGRTGNGCWTAQITNSMLGKLGLVSIEKRCIIPILALCDPLMPGKPYAGKGHVLLGKGGKRVTAPFPSSVFTTVTTVAGTLYLKGFAAWCNAYIFAFVFLAEAINSG